MKQDVYRRLCDTIIDHPQALTYSQGPFASEAIVLMSSLEPTPKSRTEEFASDGRREREAQREPQA